MNKTLLDAENRAWIIWSRHSNTCAKCDPATPWHTGIARCSRGQVLRDLWWTACEKAKNSPKDKLSGA